MQKPYGRGMKSKAPLRVRVQKCEHDSKNTIRRPTEAFINQVQIMFRLTDMTQYIRSQSRFTFKSKQDNDEIFQLLTNCYLRRGLHAAVRVRVRVAVVGVVVAVLVGVGERIVEFVFRFDGSLRGNAATCCLLVLEQVLIFGIHKSAERALSRGASRGGCRRACARHRSGRKVCGTRAWHTRGDLAETSWSSNRGIRGRNATPKTRTKQNEHSKDRRGDSTKKACVPTAYA